MHYRIHIFYHLIDVRSSVYQTAVYRAFSSALVKETSSVSEYI